MSENHFVTCQPVSKDQFFEALSNLDGDADVMLKDFSGNKVADGVRVHNIINSNLTYYICEFYNTQNLKQWKAIDVSSGDVLMRFFCK